MQDRLDLLNEWLSSVLETDYTIEVASADASFRRYFRVQTADATYIVMDAPPEHEDTRAFQAIAKLLVQQGVHAPVIEASNTALGFLLLTDLGNRTFLPELDSQTAGHLYGSAIQALHQMQSIEADLPLYDEALLRREMALFPEWMLNVHLQHQLSADEEVMLERVYALLVENSVAQPQVFVHRDYHSRNLMICDADTQGREGVCAGVLDFQDAVIGPITYDLASLYRDCYIEWPAAQVNVWVEAFRAQIAANGVSVPDSEQFQRWFDLTSAQRHIKVLGIFARLYHRDGKDGYLKDLPLTYRYLRNELAPYPEFADFCDWLDQVVGPKLLGESA